MKTDECRERLKRTNLARYGVENVLCAGGIGRLKSKTTCLERYGDENFNNRAQAAKTCLERYGSENVSQVGDFAKKAGLSHLRLNYGKLLANPHVVSMFGIDEYVSKTPDTIFSWKCIDCGNEFDAEIDWNFYGRIQTVARCPVCFPEGFRCSSEEERDFISEIRKLYDGNILERAALLETGKDRRNWLEIDCYLPDLKLGFEYNGLYFHQADGIRNRHFEKTLVAERQGIWLVHVRSDQWLLDRVGILGLAERMISEKPYFGPVPDFGTETFELDRSVYNRAVDVPGYRIAGETPPKTLEVEFNGRKYQYDDCGTLVYRAGLSGK